VKIHEINGLKKQKVVQMEVCLRANLVVFKKGCIQVNSKTQMEKMVVRIECGFVRARSTWCCFEDETQRTLKIHRPDFLRRCILACVFVCACVCAHACVCARVCVRAHMCIYVCLCVYPK